MFSEKDVAFLQQVKATVLAIDPKAEVWLFGSRARGDAREDSDWDFLVLTERIVDQEYKELIRGPLFYLGLEHGRIISTTVKNRMDWEDLELTNFYRCVQEDALAV